MYRKRAKQIFLFKDETTAVKLKRKLMKLIDEIIENPNEFLQNPDKDFTRKRKLDLKSMIIFILSSSGMRTKKELEIIHDTFVQNKYGKLPTVSAVSQQRSKIKSFLFKYLYEKLNEEFFATKDFRGYALYAVDGTDLRFYKNEESPYYYHDKDREYSQIHINCLYNLIEHNYTDVIFQPRIQIDERRALIDMLPNIKGKAIVIGDRGYMGLNVIEYFRRKEGVEILVRAKEDNNKEIASLPLKQLDTYIKVTVTATQTNEDKEKFKTGELKYIKGKSKFGKNKKDVDWDFENYVTVTYRVVRFQLESGDWETIVTTLDKENFPLRVIKKLYKMRWGIETSFRELKYAVNLNFLNCRKDELVEQNIYASLLMYNICEMISHSIHIDNRGKMHMYKVNFRDVVDKFKKFLRGVEFDIDEELQDCLSAIRRGRKRGEGVIVSRGSISFCYRVA